MIELEPEVRDWLETLPAKHRLSQTELAARAGLTQAKISRIEGSDTVPALPLLARLAAALDATLNSALDDEDT
ncbi:helix-turn-helix transcriptional regulator [Streptomyces europaeiscabiei]|uniref:helix-turn-helix transcriptional regulator n=1 Tax=Streptomyces europaeiscabiei TaxID=146819 RepID=UPI002E0DA5EB|nr:helix-turn-helix domain-containing protein [Streptomyces europaeiscabiei]